MLQVIHVSILLLFTSICQVCAHESLNDFPLYVPKGNHIIHATLTDLGTNKNYFIKEYLHSDENEKGKISINSDSSTQIDVHHGFTSDIKRLVIQDYDCDVFTYKTKWDKMIPGITKPLLNHILLVGPSLIYRLKNNAVYWQTGDDTEIRGMIMKSAYTTLDANILNITYYYKHTFSFEIGVSKPSRIEFSGNDPADYYTGINYHFVLDIHQITATDEELDKVVIPKQGIGCPLFVKSDRDVGSDVLDLVKHSVHYISIENINGAIKTSTWNEVYADETRQILSLKTKSQGITTEAIYDYTLGIIYKLKSEGSCMVSPMEPDAPGLDVSYNYHPFRISLLVNTALNYVHLGKTWFENRPGFITDVWEAIDLNGQTSSGKYDKVVSTLYTVDSKNTDTESGRVIVGETIHAYNKDSNEKYSLMELTTKDYYNFGQEIVDEAYKDRFKVSDCYPYPEDRKTLAIQFECKSLNCNNAASRSLYDFRKELKVAIANIGTISSSRIGNIEVELDLKTLKAYVTFLKVPPLLYVFKSKYVSLSKEVFKDVSITRTGSEGDCLQQNGNVATTFEAIVYCSGDKTCFKINKIDELIEDKKDGKYCQIYYIPLKNLYRYNREVSLDNIQSELKKRGLSFSIYDYRSYLQYTVSQVNEVTELESKPRQLYIIENDLTKLVEDGASTVMATNVKSLAECYRACAHLDNNDCETFSYCQSGDKTECLLSTSIYANMTDKRVYDSSCNIYRKDRLQDYTEIKDREFINPTSVATKLRINDCADLCSKSDECFSFQYCDFTCIFGGYYTDSSTKSRTRCNIYTPKLDKKFKPTGRKITIETFHTELNVNLDQCAFLCYDFTSDDGACLSYNYCPESGTASSCSLSKYSVKDPLTKTITSDMCTNYELITSHSNRGNEKQKTETPSLNEGTRKGVAFGIIIIFIAIGLVVGFTSPYTYNKSKSFIANLTSSENGNLDCKRYSNDKIAQTQSNF